MFKSWYFILSFNNLKFSEVCWITEVKPNSPSPKIIKTKKSYINVKVNSQISRFNMRLFLLLLDGSMHFLGESLRWSSRLR